MKASTITFTISIVLIIAAIVIGVLSGNKPSIYEDFAQCVNQENATFFGAFWCPHCIDQKRMFGKAEKLLPYIECSLPDRSGQTEICNNAQIQSYPTWDFADGSRLTGAQPLEVLAIKTGCELPAEHMSEFDLEQLSQEIENFESPSSDATTTEA